MKRVGFYGGSFNPPHVGHQATILHAMTTGQLDELYIVPVYKHPYNKELADYHKRMAMCDLLRKPFAHTYSCKLDISWVERKAWEEGGEGLTSNTVNMFISDYYNSHGERPHVALIMGSDVKQDLPTWKGYDQLIELCKRGYLSFFFVDRIPGLSSTAVRNSIKNGGLVDRWLPKEIHWQIRQSDLYK